MDVSPDPATVCPGATLTWEFDNRCARNIKAKIGKRRPKYPKDAHGEPLATKDELKPSPYPVPAHGKAYLKVQVDPNAKERTYKYDITGDGDIVTDPEIDVRRGGVGAPPPRPSPSPSPAGNEPNS